MKFPKTLILDVKTWRCGANGNNRLGKGSTSLLNNEGYMCCLGQFCKQVDAKICGSSPCSITHIDPSFDNNLLVQESIDSAFSAVAMEINDDPNTTPKQKIKKLRSLCKKYRRRLVVKNLHLLNV